MKKFQLEANFNSRPHTRTTLNIHKASLTRKPKSRMHKKLYEICEEAKCEFQFAEFLVINHYQQHIIFHLKKKKISIKIQI